MQVICHVMDISVFRAVCRELGEKLPGARVVDMAEGGSGELCITLKADGRKLELLVCPRPELPRIYLCAGRYCRSKSLTPSAQSIRNHIVGATVVSVRQDGLERAVALQLERKARNGLEKAALVYEMAGKKPNLIVLDAAGSVVVAQTYVALSDDAPRPLLPGLKYGPPPLPDKLDPFTATADDIARSLEQYPGLPAEKALFKCIGGVSPLLAREAVVLAGPDAGPASLVRASKELIERVMAGPYSPCIVHADKGPVLAAFGLAQYEGSAADIYGSMSEAAEAFYTLLAERMRFESEKRGLRKDAARRLETAKKKLDALGKDMARSENAQTYTLYGNLLMAQLSSVPKNASEAELPDLFSEDGSMVSIPLDPKLSPVKNAERYFRLARKALSGAAMTAARLKSTRDEAARLESLLKDIEAAGGPEELGRIAGAGPSGGKGKPFGRAGEQGRGGRFPSFVSSDGFEVLYAKNARANDLLTFKLAEPMDLWFHAQGYHGAHVIVRNPERRPDIPLNTILEAAACAAYFSDARKDSSVPVDYTFKKYVRKPRDPVSGQAIFTQNKTVFVDPARPGDDTG